MINLDTTIFYSLLEALAVLLVGMFALLAIQWRRRQARRQTLIDLVHRLKNSGLLRTSALQALLQQNARLEGAQRDEVAQQILTAETHFYQFLIRALLHRDERQLLDLDREVELLTDAISKATPHISAEVTTSTAAVAPVTVDLAPLKQALDNLQKGQQQLAQEIKAQAESLKRSFSALPVAVAASSATIAAVASAGAVPPLATENALESLPDLEDANVLAAPAAEVSTAPPPVDEATSNTATGNQIAEMPDDLLMDFDEAVATPEPTIAETAATNDAATTATGDQLNATNDFEQIAELPDGILDKNSAATETEVPAPAAASSAQSAQSAPDAGLDIDAILAAATPPEPTPAEKAPAETMAKETAAAPTKGNIAPSLDEVLAAEPLLPEIDTKPADTEAKTEPAAGPVKSSANVDDLLAELDELLK